jgi:hypothetical protein
VTFKKAVFDFKVQPPTSGDNPCVVDSPNCYGAASLLHPSWFPLYDNEWLFFLRLMAAHDRSRPGRAPVADQKGRWM